MKNKGIKRQILKEAFIKRNKFLKEQATIDDVPGKIVDPPPPPPPPQGCPCDGTSGGPADNGQGGYSPACCSNKAPEDNILPYKDQDKWFQGMQAQTLQGTWKIIQTVTNTNLSDYYNADGMPIGPHNGSNALDETTPCP